MNVRRQRIMDELSHLEFNSEKEIEFMKKNKMPITSDLMENGWECALKRAWDIIDQEWK